MPEPLTPEALPARILVTGANGNLGRGLITHLASLGADRPAVRAVVRSERAAEAVRSLPAAPELRVVDYGDADALADAARGCDAIVHLVGILKESPSARYEDAHERTAHALVKAAELAGFRRVVLLSILGSRPDSANACLASKGRSERILLDAPLATTVLRVPMVLGGDDPATWALRGRARAGLLLLPRGGRSIEQPIDAADVVAAITAALAHPELAGQCLDLGGPEALPRRELIARAAAVLGRNAPRVLPVPLAAIRAFAAVAERLLANPPITTPMLGVLEHDDRIDPAPACEALGITLRPLDETLRNALASDPDTKS